MSFSPFSKWERKKEKNFANFDANSVVVVVVVVVAALSLFLLSTVSFGRMQAASGVRSPSFPMQYGLMAHHKSHVLCALSLSLPVCTL